jgi:hypothetical protein
MRERCNSYARDRRVCLRPRLRKNQLTVAKRVSVRACRYTKFANKVSIRYSIPISNMSIPILSQVAVGPRELYFVTEPAQLVSVGR